MRELMRIAMVDPAEAFGPDGSLLELREMPEHVRRAISSFDVEHRTTEDGVTRTVRKVRFWSKTQALELLGKHIGMLVERREVATSTITLLFVQLLRSVISCRW